MQIATISKISIFPPSVTPKECSDTGMAMVLIALLFFLFTAVKGWLVGAMILLVVNMIAPTLYKFAAIGWLGFSHLLGTIMSKVILTIIFFCVVTPLALFRRMCGHDPMQLKLWRRNTNSVFATRDHTFTPEEIEKPY